MMHRPMFRLNRPLLAVALFALAAVARADAPRLLAPADGATLRGGSYAELRWSAAPLPAATEEWEAFLSIDGGKYYAFRVTPHLDIELRRFTFIVPNVDTDDARILIRTGDEVHETHFEIPGSFSIVRDPNAGQIAPRLLQLGRGEAAREGDPAVVSWTEGARNGSGVSQQAAPASPSSSLGGLIAAASDAAAVLSSAVHGVSAPPIVGTETPSRDKQALEAQPRPLSVDLLLVCRRRNI
jgi:hypothetical protein